MRITFRCNLLIGMLTILSILNIQSYAQQWSGFWTDRARSYGDTYCNAVNPEYGEYQADCANFTSQLANAGCSGMCESNNTNPPTTGLNPPTHPPWEDPIGALSCDNYVSPNTNNCHDCLTENHQIIASAVNQNAWFNQVDDNWPYDNTYTLWEPGMFYASVGDFVHFHWNSGGWHCSWVCDVTYGEGTDNMTYWLMAHSNPHCGYGTATNLTVEQMFNSGSGAEHMIRHGYDHSAIVNKPKGGDDVKHK
ncbi:amidase domain-containing protein [bacterium]|nr:amidase domain-containing protein [bacterium]